MALLAVHGDSAERPFVAGNLWSDRSADRATGSLRSALWYVRRECPDLIECNSHRLTLSTEATSDVRFLESAAKQIRVDVCPRQLVESDQQLLAKELSPGWYDDWVILARERFRQLSLHTLESVAHRLCTASMSATAVQAALGAICLDPLRESSDRSLICIYLAEGNQAEALRVRDNYTNLLLQELGLTPSEKMGELMQQVCRP